jgi:hypothetical protein
LESGAEYIEINCFTENQLKSYAERQRRFSAPITKNWDKKGKVEWLVRNYLSLKMILSSTLLLNSAEFAFNNNLRVVEPYLLYYSLLNTGRALLFADPSIEWKDGELIRQPHSYVINKTSELIRIISSIEGAKVKNLLEEAKGFRELFSYRFPANGISGITSQSQEIDLEETIRTCRLISEIAQFNSEILQKSCEKNIKEDIEISRSDLNEGYIYTNYMKSHYEENSESVFDQEDFYRLGYFVRKK